MVLLLATLAVACTPRTVQRFGVEQGRAAFVQLADPTLPVAVSSTINLPAGATFVSAWGDMGVLITQPVGEGSEISLYGVYRDGAMVLPCQYRKIETMGAFYLAQYRMLDEAKIEIYNRSGTLLIGTEDTSASAYAVGEDHFVLYTADNAQLFDATGEPYFLDGVLQPQDRVAICGDYVLTTDAAGTGVCVWDGSNILRHRFYAADTRYVAAYLGGRFLITAISQGNAKQYTYIEHLDGEDYYMRQQAWWYDPRTDTTTKANLDYVVLSVRNAFTPGLSRDEVAAMHLAEGYSVAVVAELNNAKEHVSDRYYVIDASATPVVRYPVDINPAAIVFRADRGFAGSALAGSAAALYDLACNLVWQDKTHAYATMRWQSGRLTASYYEDGVNHYGAFDSEGNVAVPFEYAYMSPYFGGKCAVRSGDQYYIVDDAGKTLSAISIACPEHWLGFGVYTYREGDLVGLKNLAGDVVVAPLQQIDAIGADADGHTYILCQQGDTQAVLVLR